MTMAESIEKYETAAPLVLVHGDFGDGYDTWGETARLLGARRAIIVDRPGFGVALAPDDRFTVAGDASYLEHIVQDMGLTSMHLVGHSYGALVALDFAVRQPRLVRSLHLIEPPLLSLLAEDDDVQQMELAIRELQSRHAETGDEATTAAFFPMIGANRVVERVRGTPEWSRLCGYATRFARSEPAGAYPAANVERLPRDLPLALYSGGRSHPVLRRVAAVLAKRRPDARFTEVAGAGHAVQMAGLEFVEPLLALTTSVDRSWEECASATGETARE
jgi:pimeloyl-ACP methyl ester carboxylesterase